jgi:hypothetical protein
LLNESDYDESDDEEEENELQKIYQSTIDSKYDRIAETKIANKKSLK